MLPRSPRRLLFALAAIAGGGAGAQPSRPPGWNPADSIRQLPSYRPAHDTLTLLAPARIARNARGDSAAWTAYLAHSRALHARDTTSMNAELRRVGRDTMTRAPYAHDFDVSPHMTPAWFATDSARRMAESILSYQAPDGGWSKHVDFTRGPRSAGQSYFAETNEWSWISTLDNGATTAEMRFLALADRARHDARYRAAFLRGLDWLLAAQAPNGCWPQNYPLEGSYHDAITFNDDAVVLALRRLDETARGDYPFVPAATRDSARAAAARGVECLLRTQVRVRDTLTAWGQQHDPLTLVPTSARSYELASLSALESAQIVDYLMELPRPSARVVSAVHAAAAWLRRSARRDSAYEGYELRARPGAGPLWARLYEIGTDRPIFSNRDGVLLYDFDKLTDRRRGYGWFTVAPAETLRRYDAWAKRYPRS